MKRTKNNPLFNKVTRTRKAVDVLYEKMVFYDNRAKKILNAIIEDMKLEVQADAKTRLAAVKMLKDCDEIALDCAVKLAPFQTPKLESVEVNAKVENRYVMRAPVISKSEQDWMKSTGAIMHEPPKVIEHKAVEHKPTIHDFADDEEDDIEDQRATFNSIN